MSLTAKQTTTGAHSQRQVWNVPLSRARWLWLLPSAIFTLAIYLWYQYAIHTQKFPGPFNDPLRIFGILAFCLVLATASYSLRRRFARALPGKVQDWLWMHTRLGIAAVLIALFHENFAHVLHDYCQNASCFTQSYAGTSALYALILLVASGVIGRLIDIWQTRRISRDASTNGVGIVRALEERILELEYTVERLCAGKSEAFQQFCLQALDEKGGTLPSAMPMLPATEHGDFQRAQETLSAHSQLTHSLQEQQRARVIIRTWRSIHMLLASLALLIILYHGIMELLTNVLHIG